MTDLTALIFTVIAIGLTFFGFLSIRREAAIRLAREQQQAHLEQMIKEDALRRQMEKKSNTLKQVEAIAMLIGATHKLSQKYPSVHWVDVPVNSTTAISRQLKDLGFYVYLSDFIPDYQDMNTLFFTFPDEDEELFMTMPMLKSDLKRI